MVCHGELARSRPSAKHLTEFYLWISVGGVLGGTFNALIAPVIFHSVIEFPLVLVLAALLRPAIDVKENTQRGRTLDFLLPAILGLSLLAVILALQALGLKPGLSISILVFGLSLEWCLSFGRRPIRFASGSDSHISGQHLLSRIVWPHTAYGAQFFRGVSRDR